MAALNSFAKQERSRILQLLVDQLCNLGGEETYGYIVALLAESNRGSEAANTGANYEDVERARVRHWDG
jgi:hypothetical protein